MTLCQVQSSGKKEVVLIDVLEQMACGEERGMKLTGHQFSQHRQPVKLIHAIQDRRVDSRLLGPEIK
jgi:hypothetical protein